MKDLKNIDITDCLLTGSNNYRSANELRYMLQLDNRRDVTKLIQKARLEGNIICSNTKGYFLPNDAGEIKIFVKKINHRIGEIKKSIRNAEKLIQEEGVHNGS